MSEAAATVPGLVSTIIPVFNRPVMVRQAIESVLAQTYRPIEIIVVDDGSTDRTRDVLRELSPNHPQELIVLQQSNSGPGVARERGRSVARGEFLQYLDSDDWLYPNKFEDQVGALREYPDSSIAYGTTTLSDEYNNISEKSGRRTAERITNIFPALLVDRWWYTHTPLYRRWISDAVGSWTNFRQREDWDLDARMGALRPRLIHCGSTVSNHRHYQSPSRASQASPISCLDIDRIFLPRLFSAAVLAGVQLETEEMQHFSRWAFLRARDLDAIHEYTDASRLFHLACCSTNRLDLSLKWYGMSRLLFGPSLTSRLSRLLRPGSISIA